MAVYINVYLSPCGPIVTESRGKATWKDFAAESVSNASFPRRLALSDDLTDRIINFKSDLLSTRMCDLIESFRDCDLTSMEQVKKCKDQIFQELEDFL